MAKRCVACHNTFSDDKEKCPVCHAAGGEFVPGDPTETGHAGGHAPTPAGAGSDSAIDLGLPPADAIPGGRGATHSDPSNASSVPWASLVEDEAAPLPEPARFDSPSDVDLLRQTGGGERPSGSGSGSEIDLGGGGPADADEGGSVPSDEFGVGDADSVDSVDALVDDAAVAAFLSAAGDTGAHRPPQVTDLAGAAGEHADDGPDSASRVRLGEEPREAGPGMTSGVDLRDLELADDAAVLEGLSGPAGHDPAASHDSGIDLAVEGMPPGADDDAIDFGERGDPIADAVESGVDLGLPPEGAKREGTGMTALGAAGGPDEESVDLGSADPIDLTTSAVNLGGSPLTQVHTPEEFSLQSQEGAGEAAPPPEPAPRAVRKPAPSEVDLGAREEGPSFVWTSGSSMPPPAAPDSGSHIDLGGGSPPTVSGSDSGGPVDAADDFPDEPPAPTPPRPSAPRTRAAAPPAPAGRRTAWAGGTALGTLVGAAACLALWFSGIEPPGEWRGKTKPAAPEPAAPVRVAGPPAVAPDPGPPAPAAPALTAEDHLRRGDFEEASRAGIDRAEGDQPERLARSGENRFLTYYRKRRLAGAAVSRDDPPVKEAVAALEKAAAANDAGAILWLGQVYEATNEVDKALATYAKGVKAFENDAGKRQVFQAQLDRLESRPGDKAAGAALPAEGAALLALAVIALQAQPPAPAAAEGADEAGFQFWHAAKLARSEKYAEAVKELDAARKLHDRGRFARLRKAQNPMSDPTEEIFLRACDELKAYWLLEARLRDGGYLAGGRDPVKAVDALVAKANEGSKATAGPDTKALAEKLVGAKVIDRPDELASGVDRLLKARLEAAAKLDELEAARLRQAAGAEKAVAKALAEAERAAKSLSAAEEAAKGNDAKWKEARANLERTEKMLTEARKRADDATGREDPGVRKAVDELVKANFLDAKAGKEGLLEGVRGAIQAARSADREELVRKLQADLARTREQARRAEEAASAALEKPRERLAQAPAGSGYAGDALAADQHYADGLAYYFARRYPEAERALAAAVSADDLDARFHYFLALARAAQGKSAAAQLWRGAALEAQGRPPRPAVDEALERVQGDARRSVDDARK